MRVGNCFKPKPRCGHSGRPQSAGFPIGEFTSFLHTVRKMKTLAEDTSPEAERVLIELYRKATIGQKLAMVEEANRTAKALAMTGLKERYPNESPEKLRRRLADLWLGPELAAKAYGPLPE
jgi:hypothetical protein